MAESSGNSSSPNRFFILGCQRTGTTLLRLVLECHPDIACFDEATSYRALAELTAANAPGKRLLGFKIPRWTEQLRQGMLGDPGQRERTGHFYNGEPLVFLLRDVRDTVVSMSKLRMGRQTWMDVAGRPILEAKLEEHAFRHRFAAEIGLLEKFGKSTAAVGALYWKYKTAAYLDYQKLNWPVCGVHYERLVSSPAEQLRRITSVLGVTWNDSLLDHAHFPHTEILPSGLAMGNTDPQRPIDVASVRQWEKALSPRDIEQILAIAGDLNEQISAEEMISAAAT